jgi:hypothetical protein
MKDFPTQDDQSLKVTKDPSVQARQKALSKQVGPNIIEANRQRLNPGWFQLQNGDPEA